MLTPWIADPIYVRCGDGRSQHCYWDWTCCISEIGQQQPKIPDWRSTMINSLWFYYKKQQAGRRANVLTSNASQVLLLSSIGKLAVLRINTSSKRNSISLCTREAKISNGDGSGSCSPGWFIDIFFIVATCENKCRLGLLGLGFKIRLSLMHVAAPWYRVRVACVWARSTRIINAQCVRCLNLLFSQVQKGVMGCTGNGKLLACVQRSHNLYRNYLVRSVCRHFVLNDVPSESREGKLN